MSGCASVEVDVSTHGVFRVLLQIQHHAGVLGGQSLRSAHLHRPRGAAGGPAAGEGPAGLIPLPYFTNGFHLQLGLSQRVASHLGQEGKDYIPLGSYTNGKTLHSQAFTQNLFAVTNLRCENKTTNVVVIKKKIKIKIKLTRDKCDSSSCSYMRSMSTLQVFEELPCKDADCPEVRHPQPALQRGEPG